MKLNKKVDQAVQKYMESIVSAVKEESFDMDIDVDEEEALNENRTESARSFLITTKIGSVIIIPDFNNYAAMACILNVGMINYLQAEGFDENFIETEGRIYGDPKPHTDNNVNAFAYYLTHKINVTTKNKALG